MIDRAHQDEIHFAMSRLWERFKKFRDSRHVTNEEAEEVAKILFEAIELIDNYLETGRALGSNGSES